MAYARRGHWASAEKNAITSNHCGQLVKVLLPNRSAGTYAEFRLRRWRHGKFFDLLFKT